MLPLDEVAAGAADAVEAEDDESLELDEDDDSDAVLEASLLFDSPDFAVSFAAGALE